MPVSVCGPSPPSTPAPSRCGAARRAPPHYAAAALRVVDAALDAALSSPLVDASGGGGGGGGGGEEIDQFAAMDALDDAARAQFATLPAGRWLIDV